jgi:hypothetical protein
LFTHIIQEAAIWFHAEGEGLSRGVIDKNLRHLRKLLQLMSSKTPLIIQSIEEHEKLKVEVSVEELLDILQSRYVC